MIPLYKPYMPPTPDIEKILISGQIAYGKYTEEFEEKLKSYFGTPYLLVTNSFHTAILVALTSLGIKPGYEVVASPMACLASTQPYSSFGVSINWSDVDSVRGTLSPGSVEKVLTNKTKAIVHNHFCGYPGYIDEINYIGKKYGIPVIDDGIECFGSKYKGKLIGNCGTDVTVFSLTAVRFCNCIDGGIVIFKEKELYEKALMIRDCGIDRTRFRDDIGEINVDCDILLNGYSAMMSNVNGYIGLCQMNCLDEVLQKHKKLAKKWRDFLTEKRQYMPICCEDTDPNYWIFGIHVEDKREAILKFREMGYYASGVHIRNDIYSVFGKSKYPLPGVDSFFNSFVALPCGWWME